MSEGKKKYIKVTESGRLYITEEDFFRREAFRRSLQKLIDSDLSKKIKERNSRKQELESETN